MRSRLDVLAISKAKVLKLFKVNPPKPKAPTVPLPPGLMVSRPLPATTLPDMEPLGPLASVPPWSDRLPEPSAEPMVFAITSDPANSVVPPE